MKRSILLSTALCSLALFGCSTYTGIKPLYPEVGNPNYPPKEVDSFTPTLRWEASPEPDATYDLIIYEGIGKWSFWHQDKRKGRAPGREAYYRERLQETVHEIEETLKPDTEYYWSVRVRRGQRVSSWARYDFLGQSNMYFMFVTPEEENRQEQQEEVKTPVMQLEYPAHKFSVMGAPQNWKISQAFPNAVVGWTSDLTHSEIGIMADYNVPPEYFPDAYMAEIMALRFAGGIRAQNPEATVTLSQPEAVTFNGNRFYRVNGEFTTSPVQGRNVTVKNLLYFLRTKNVVYGFVLVAVTGHYDRDVPILEDMLRSFTLLE